MVDLFRLLWLLTDSWQLGQWYESVGAQYIERPDSTISQIALTVILLTSLDPQHTTIWLENFIKNREKP